MIRNLRHSAVWLFHLVAVGVGASLFIMLTSCCSSTRSQQTDYRALVEEGKPIVEAIYKFRNRNGLWPQYLDDLGPDAPPAVRGRKWRYQWNYDGRWSLINYSDVPRSAISYEVSENQGCWKLTDGETEVRLDIKQPLPAESHASIDELRKNRQAELCRRIEREPKEIIHYLGLVSYLVETKQLEEARIACRQCLEAFPDHWWSTLALALVESQGPGESAKAAELRLVAWGDKHADFLHYFYVAQYYRELGRKEDAILMLGKAAQFPMVDSHLKDGTATWESSVQGCGWDSATLAYSAHNYSVALSICHGWERYRSEKGEGDTSFYAFRAACYLALGKIELAKEQVGAALKEQKTRSNWAKNVESLAKAVADGNQEFVYQPGKYPPPFKLLLEYK